MRRITLPWDSILLCGLCIDAYQLRSFSVLYLRFFDLHFEAVFIPDRANFVPCLNSSCFLVWTRIPINFLSIFTVRMLEPDEFEHGPKFFPFRVKVAYKLRMNTGADLILSYLHIFGWYMLKLFTISENRTEQCWAATTKARTLLLSYSYMLGLNKLFQHYNNLVRGVQHNTKLFSPIFVNLEPPGQLLRVYAMMNIVSVDYKTIIMDLKFSFFFSPP